MARSDSLDFFTNGADILPALEGVMSTLQHRGIDPPLYHLVLLRASQINGCAFCVKMHLQEARRDGETQERLDALIVWRHTKDFTQREEAALAWTEALTQPDSADMAPLRSQLRNHFEDREIATLTVLVGMINLWNRIQISDH